MLITREVLPEEKEAFNQLVDHPLQSWEWGEFREKTGVEVVRIGAFEGKKIKAAYQITLHPIPFLQTDWKVIYFPKGPMPDQPMLSALKDLASEKKAVFVRLEPDVGAAAQLAGETRFETIKNFLLTHNCRPGRPLFTHYTLRFDLKKSEKQILTGMKEKTRYNLGLAEKYGVRIVKDHSLEAFETYLKLMQTTTQRQGFYAHNQNYHRKLWETLEPAGMAHLFQAQYQKKTLAAWLLLTFKKNLYYPYGASSREHREVMPAYALMWEAIKFGQKKGCTSFDLWGSLGPKPNSKDPWYGFHRFKSGFGPELVEFLGTFDLIINQQLYPLVRLGENMRWRFLRLKSKLKDKFPLIKPFLRSSG
ncbi:MAG: peptidoglycan bridge formation glycyltransferase FemA/FemB family protein [Candidatus Pacebacteria bacterium]|nr:peptidoglycan bridge formation glycyltransferase FemA/FemB family protein [Candidatus Paceibacterota bacterium]